MRWRLLAGVLLFLAAGCSGAAQPEQTGPDPFADSPPPVSSVDVDTPELRALKEKAGIAECPRTEAVRPAAGGLPDIALPCLGGGPNVHLADLTGKPTVINVWASWCPPCREELPILQQYAERADGQVRMLGVDFQDVRPDAALELARRSGVTYPSVADLDGRLEQVLRLRGLPWTVIVDTDGRIAHTVAGQIHSVEQLNDAVEDAVGVTVSG